MLAASRLLKPPKELILSGSLVFFGFCSLFGFCYPDYFVHSYANTKKNTVISDILVLFFKNKKVDLRKRSVLVEQQSFE